MKGKKSKISSIRDGTVIDHERYTWYITSFNSKKWNNNTWLKFSQQKKQKKRFNQNKQQEPRQSGIE